MSRARSADRRAQRGTYGVMSEARYAGVQSGRARNTMTSSLYSMRPVKLLQHCCHALPVALPNPQNNSGRRPMYHLKTVQEAVGDAIQYSVPVVDPRRNEGVNKSLASYDGKACSYLSEAK